MMARDIQLNQTSNVIVVNVRSICQYWDWNEIHNTKNIAIISPELQLRWFYCSQDKWEHCKWKHCWLRRKAAVLITLHFLAISWGWQGGPGAQLSKPLQVQQFAGDGILPCTACDCLLVRGPMLLWQQLVPGDLTGDQLTGPQFLHWSKVAHPRDGAA